MLRKKTMEDKLTASILLLVLSAGCLSEVNSQEITKEPPTTEIKKERTINTLKSENNANEIRLDRWDIHDREYSYEELEAKYIELYDFSFPYVFKEEITAEVVPTGVPEIYGEHLGVSYDGNPDAMIMILRQFEGIYLEDGLLQRYINIGTSISCEYCCGVDAIVHPDGSRACGCAHSYAMRGLTKYLLLEHPDEYTDEEILAELARWKATYFPKQSIQKVFNNYIETNSIDPSILAEMPNMVGRC
jgi:hypothetical protein